MELFLLPFTLDYNTKSKKGQTKLACPSGTGTRIVCPHRFWQDDRPTRSGNQGDRGTLRWLFGTRPLAPSLCSGSPTRRSTPPSSPRCPFLFRNGSERFPSSASFSSGDLN